MKTTSLNAPSLSAISFREILEKGGRTKPWLILVDTGGSLKPYVVKLFETTLIEERDSVTNEVIGNILAKQFDLPVPNAALIDMDDDFIATIKDQRLLELLEAKDGRLKFGSELLEGFVRFDSSAFSVSDTKGIIEIDSVFAFDNLIRNRDRNNGKPNLLVKSDQAYLIDHELGFEITGNTIKELLNWQWDSKFYQYHIFYPYLKNSLGKYKEEYFHVFEEYLRLLNINILNSYLTQLSSSGFSHRNHTLIIEYLTQMKRNSSNFVNLLKGVIS